MFRLRTDLIDRLKSLAAKDNRSLNNYVETILMDVVYNTPNSATLAAIKEARDDSNLTTVDMTSFDAFRKSLEM